MANNSAPNNQANPQGAIPVYGGGMCYDTLGQYVIDPNNWPIAYAYTATPGQIDHLTISDPFSSRTFRRTYTYNGDQTTNTISGWVKQ